MTGSQAFQFDIHAMIQMIVWGLVLVAIATAFISFGNKRKTDALAGPVGKMHPLEQSLTEDRVRQIVREEIAEALRALRAEPRA